MDEPVIVDTDVMPLLVGLRDLLMRYDHAQRADFIGALIRAGESDELWLTASGLEFWGGSGAIWEVEPFQFTRPSVVTASADYRRFQELMVDLGAMLEARGLATLSERTVTYFRDQLEAGG